MCPLAAVPDQVNAYIEYHDVAMLVADSSIVELLPTGRNAQVKALMLQLLPLPYAPRLWNASRLIVQNGQRDLCDPR